MSRCSSTSFIASVDTRWSTTFELMFNWFILVILLATTQCEAGTQLSRSHSLRLAIVLFRHGDRSPGNTFPSDPHKNYPWIGGYLALQPKGIEQIYKLGLDLRDRYGQLIPEHGMYTRDSTLVLSSASERCILTAQSLLASFYAPPKDAINISIPWQPVTVNTLAPEVDIILGQRRRCPRLDQIREGLLRNPTPELQQWFHDGNVLKDFVSEKIGAKVATMRDLSEILDALEIYHAHGLSLPEWASEVFPTKAAEFIRGYQLTFSATDELKRIRGGAILRELLTKMKAKQNGTMTQSLLFYSAHDVTQTNLFNTMGITELLKVRPGFGATTVFELYESLGNDMEVRMVHYPNTDQKVPIELNIPKCGKPCSLTNFERSVRNFLLDDYDQSCAKVEQ